MRSRTVLLVLATTVAVAAACGDSNNPAERYNITMTGQAERPTPVATNASGTATLTVKDENTIDVVVTVANIDSATASHIHSGDATVAGGIIIGLFAGPPTPLATTTTLVTGTITRQSTFNAAYTFDSLLTHIRDGTAYVNVHTKVHPGGEIRGQILR